MPLADIPTRRVIVVVVVVVVVVVARRVAAGKCYLCSTRLIGEPCKAPGVIEQSARLATRAQHHERANKCALASRRKMHASRSTSSAGEVNLPECCMPE